jgi:uncharacterized repeat protein (TIGR02543 family)
LATVSRSGYAFDGWFTDAASGTRVTADTLVSITTNHTLYAHWYAGTTPADYRETETIPALTITGSGSSVVFITGRTVTLSPYQIAKYEITYELWYEVKTWATSHSYTFANAGREGHDGTDGAAPTSAKTEPVTMVNWWDTVVWCNAYSEMSGKTPVYTVSGATFKNAAASSTTLDALDITRSGYRLPTEAEWEAAARGGNPSDTTNWAYPYAGSDTIGNVAWYWDNSGSATHAVGGKAANLAGLHDMSGNVWEWCWDWYGTITTGTVTNPPGASSGYVRVMRGGSWSADASYCAVSGQNNNYPDYRSIHIGFRVVCRGE